MPPKDSRARAAAAVAAVVVAVVAQFRLDVAPALWLDAGVLFAVAIWLWRRGLGAEALEAPSGGMAVVPGPALEQRRRRLLVAGVVAVGLTAVLWPALAGPEGGGLGILAYPGGAGHPANHLTAPGLVLWALGLAAYMAAVLPWPRVRRPRLDLGAEAIQLRVSSRSLALAAVVALAIVYRFYDLGGVPMEMTSDHTEKLKDVASVLDGLRPVFFYGNAGREAIQFYWTALLVKLGMPLSFLTLKVGMALVSVATVPLVYRLGRQVAGVETGLLAALVMTLAPWHIQITRIGLRIALSPFFVALTFVVLFRALETGRRDHWVAAALAAGAGVYGYTGYRPMLLVVAITILLRLVHASRGGFSPDREAAKALGGHMAASAAAAALLLAPLARYAYDRPDAFWFRTISRVTGSEAAIAGSPWSVALSNWRNALLMFNLTADTAWFQSPPGRPALETVGGGLLVLGVVTALYRARHGDWRSAALLASVPVLVSASALSLAFPRENPSLSRAAAALPPIAVLAALPLPVLGRRLRAAGGEYGTGAYMIACFALFAAMAHNTGQRYFVEYRTQYDRSTHHTTQYAAVMRDFVALGGDLGHAYLVGWRHGPDYRAIGDLAGDPDWQGLLWGAADDGSDAVQQAELAGHPRDPVRKLYLVGGPRAAENLAYLRSLYPRAMETHHPSAVEGKDFWSLLVPGEVALP